jgi:hypothetical protein
MHKLITVHFTKNLCQSIVNTCILHTLLYESKKKVTCWLNDTNTRIYGNLKVSVIFKGTRHVHNIFSNLFFHPPRYEEFFSNNFKILYCPNITPQLLTASPVLWSRHLTMNDKILGSSPARAGRVKPKMFKIGSDCSFAKSTAFRR